MKLYLLSQTINDDYATYDSCVVCAKDENDARSIHPGDDRPDVEVKYIGTALEELKRGVICASFNAGYLKGQRNE